MKRYLLCILLSVMVAMTFAQTVPPLVAQPAAPKTYAVVVGISKYQTESLSLDFADRDAAVFADYLRSKAGGSVPEDNIRLLLNDKATYGAIYDALDWLLATCQPGDLVYFYFSGHGDMEHQTIFQIGFLLSFNTPRNNYINNAVRIEDLNNIANTLSITNKANVVLITDACHSGKLTGSENRGINLVGEQLRTVQKKEIRITSCTTDQLSSEDAGWGGGRGVFSYYLVKGLKGLADREPDGTVTLAELRNYLDSSLARDPLLARKEAVQTPVLKGKDDFKMANVDPQSLAEVKAPSVTLTAGINPAPAMPLKPLKPQPQTYILSTFRQKNINKILDFKSLLKLPAADVPASILQFMADSIINKSDWFYYDISDPDVFTESVAAFRKVISQNKDAVTLFNNKLAVILGDIGQDVINKYLEGDAAELERRRYYNAANNGYDTYPLMFELAQKISEDKYLHKILQIKQYYFAGVALRLKIPLTEEKLQPALVDKALAWQLKAYDLEPNAAYIENELGNLYLYKKNLKEAYQHLLRATQIAPSWAIPWSNLSGLYIAQKKYADAQESSLKARKLQTTLPSGYNSAGVAYQETGNFLLAEEMYHKSIKLNSRDYYPFDRAAYLYMNTTRYAVADSFFYEADVRKKGFHVAGDSGLRIDANTPVLPFPQYDCPFDTLDVVKNDAAGQFVWANKANDSGNVKEAEKHYKLSIAADPTNPLSFHYLGKLLYKQQRWEEADIIFNLALKYYLGDSVFEHVYIDSLAKHLPKTKSKDCIIKYFASRKYNGIDDHYFLGLLYETWDHFNEAEKEYRKIISIDHNALAGYLLLWQMLEKTGHYKDAESVMISLEPYNKEVADDELAAFYERMIRRFPELADWYYTAGIFLHRMAMDDPGKFEHDYKEIVPDSGEERYKREHVTIINGKITHYLFKPASPEFVFIPAVLDYRILSGKMYFPRTKGIEYLKKADSLYQQDEDAIADINWRIGDLYVGQGLPGKASPYYKTTVDLKPDDANTRIKLVDSYAYDFNFKDALEQLDSLNSRHEINFDKRLMLSEFLVHAGRFDEAAVLLKEAQQIHPYRISTIADLNGRLYLLKKDQAKAIPFYMDYLSQVPGDSLCMYSIARLYAQSGKKAAAMEWLQKAISHGYDYSWVLKMDPAFNAMRKQSQWTKLMAQVKPRLYVNTLTGQ